MNQQTALALLKSGKNIFLTGSAGAGKTYVLNQYIGYLRERKVPVAVTASTGIAATHMNGMTLHAWSGIGIRDTLSEKDLVDLQSRKYLQESLEKVKVLIIDEVSMLHRMQLDATQKVLQFFRKNSEAFGGIQVVFSGDFFQLPPVGRREESNREKFAFMAQAWQDAAPTICYLTEQHRQDDDVLNRILNEIRSGAPGAWTLEQLRGTRHNTLAGGDLPQLFTHNVDVDRINDERLMALPEKPVLIKAVTKGRKKMLETLRKSVPTEEILKLKKGARVMFVRNNYEKGFMNGTLGTVKGFNDEGLPEVEIGNGRRITAETEKWSVENTSGKTLASFTQVPLRLAWAITVHKSQGMTLDAAEMDLSKTFERGQGYVALSRLRNINGLRLTGFNARTLEIDEWVQRADVRFRELSAEAESRAIPGELEKTARDFLRRCGGLLDDAEVDKHRRRKKEKKKASDSTYAITRQYIEKKLSVDEIARERGLAPTTIAGHISKVRQLYPDTDIAYLRPPETLFRKVEEAYLKLLEEGPGENTAQNSFPGLKALFERLGESVSYEEIKLCLQFVAVPESTIIVGYSNTKGSG